MATFTRIMRNYRKGGICIIVFFLILLGMFFIIYGSFFIQLPSHPKFSITPASPIIENEKLTTENATFSVEIKHTTEREIFVMDEPITLTMNITLTSSQANTSIECVTLQNEQGYHTSFIKNFSATGNGYYISFNWTRKYLSTGNINITYPIYIYLSDFGWQHTNLTDRIYLESRSEIEKFETNRYLQEIRFQTEHSEKMQERFNYIVIGLSIVMVAGVVTSVVDSIIKLKNK